MSGSLHPRAKGQPNESFATDLSGLARANIDDRDNAWLEPGVCAVVKPDVQRDILPGIGHHFHSGYRWSRESGFGGVSDNPDMTAGADTSPGEHIVGIDHVQVAMPAGREAEARRFYSDVLGLREVPKPAGLAGRGGCWFASADGSVAVHLGIEGEFRPARKAHPAFVVADLDGLRGSLTSAGAEIVEDDTIDVRRFYTADPFGNRIELVAEADRGFTTERDRSNFGLRPSRVTTDRSGGSSPSAPAR